MKVIKRDGREVSFERNKIINAINKAVAETEENITKDNLQTIVIKEN
mgnify:CR=1 FL=1